MLRDGRSLLNTSKPERGPLRTVPHTGEKRSSKSRGSLGGKGFDPGHFLFSEAQLAGAHYSLGLKRVARADNVVGNLSGIAF
jgi:hypothetical protein